MGVTERRRREREAVRGKILDAARDLFAEQGYDAVSMRKIAEKIEYSPTVIYQYFRDKEDLLRQLCEGDFLAFSSEFARVADLADPTERLKAAGRAYVQFALTHPNQFRLMFMTPMPAMKDIVDPSHKGKPHEDAYAFLRATVEGVMAAGRFRPGHTDPDLLAQTVWAGIHGVIALHIAMANDPWVEWCPLERRVDAMLDGLMWGLGGPEAG